jgi:hypothetical protein
MESDASEKLDLIPTFCNSTDAVDFNADGGEQSGPLSCWDLSTMIRNS